MSQPTVDMDHADLTYSSRQVGGAYSVLAPLPLLDLTRLSDDESALVDRLALLIQSNRFFLDLQDAYYQGQIRIPDLGISIPPQMRGLHTAIGWPRVCVDALDERLDVQGFRLPTSTDVDSDLQDIWLANDMDSESQLTTLDALVFGHGYVAVGAGESSDMPLITVESPKELGIEWDIRTRSVAAALRVWSFEGSYQGTLYLPDQTVSLVKDQMGWEVVDRDVHNLGKCPVVRVANRPRSYSREGTSEITREIMSITDAACRTLQGLEVAREFYSAPQRYILGADESDFQSADGTAKTGWETYLGRILAIGLDDEGHQPTVGQFTPYDPSTFTKVIDMYAKIISSQTGLPPHVLGYTTDNPASADAIRSTENRLKLKADRKTRMFGTAWRDVMNLALLIRDGQLPAGTISTVWADTATPTPAATADAIFKQVQMGYMPAQSDVVGEKLGYTPIERQRIEADRAQDQGETLLAEVASSLAAKEIRAAGGVDKALGVTGPTGANPDAAPPAK